MNEEAVEPTSGDAEAVILIKGRDAKGAYCAGVTPDGRWLRIAPLKFRHREDAHKLKRWDRVMFRWERPAKDARPEARAVVKDSFAIIGELAREDRAKFVQAMQRDSLRAVEEAGLNLALIAPTDVKFNVQKKTPAEMQEGADGKKPFGYKFSYKFTTKDGVQECAYDDPVMNTTMENLARSIGEPQALARMLNLYGKEHVSRGLYFAMGRDGGRWLIHAVIGRDETVNLVANLDLVI